MKRDDPCILVVDDEEVNIQLLVSYFKRTNFEVIFANTGKDALDKMQNIHPDLVLLDIQMPGINGIEVLKIAKSIEAINDLPIVMLTASNSEENRTKSFEQGATAYITKPINFKEMMNEINKALGLS